MAPIGPLFTANGAYATRNLPGPRMEGRKQQSNDCTIPSIFAYERIDDEAHSNSVADSSSAHFEAKIEPFFLQAQMSSFRPASNSPCNC
eukprot:4216371-Amphidinium_carterae.1